MISGISREKPVLDLFRCIDRAWSLYERMGDMTMKKGATQPINVVNHAMLSCRGAASEALRSTLCSQLRSAPNEKPT